MYVSVIIMKPSSSIVKILSRVLGVIVFLLIVVFLGIQWMIFLEKRKIMRYDTTLQEQKQALHQIKNYTGYTTLLSIWTLEQKKITLPWSKHIRQILDILQDLKSVNNGSNKTIVLSDFEVGLDHIKLNGKVTTLKALYHNSSSGKFRSLLDRFQDLDFISDLEIKDYEKNNENDKYYTFVLHAKVMSDAR